MQPATPSTTAPPVSPAHKRAIAGLVAAATGILIQFLSLPEDFPTVPPGPIIVGAAAIFVAVRARSWWSPLIGLGVSVMIAVGSVLNGGATENLTGSAGPAAGAALMMVGFAAAIVAGVVVLWRRRSGLDQPTVGAA